MTANEYGVSLWGNEIVVKLIVGIVTWVMEVEHSPLLAHCHLHRAYTWDRPTSPLLYTLTPFYILDLVKGFRVTELFLEICFVNSALVLCPLDLEALKHLGMVSTNTILPCHLAWFLGDLCFRGWAYSAAAL